MLHEIYYNIGQVEVQDQIDVTKQLVSLYPFIDKSRVAIWGWSYGGFVTASVLARDADQSNIFQCGISVAPVTNWIYYDSIYSERSVFSLGFINGLMMDPPPQVLGSTHPRGQPERLPGQ